jgi:hypothetical protein
MEREVQVIRDVVGTLPLALQRVQNQTALIIHTNETLLAKQSFDLPDYQDRAMKNEWITLQRLLDSADSDRTAIHDEYLTNKQQFSALMLQISLHFKIMSYRRGVFASGPISTALSPEDNGVWTFADLSGNGTQDLVHIKTRNTDTGKVQVHGAPNDSLFQTRTSPTNTAFGIEEQNGTWVMQDWTGNGQADLIYIKTRNTGTNSVEIHVATAESGYQNFARQVGTRFKCEDDGVWSMSSKGDLVYIKTHNCGSGKIEYHVASKSSGYKDFTQHVPTDFDVEDNGTWCIAPTCSGDFADLYYIKTRNTRSGKVEVHAVSASSGWKSRLAAVVTSFEPEDNGWWKMANLSHQDRPDLVYIKTSSCESGKVEVNVVEQEQAKPLPVWKSSQSLSWEDNTSLPGSLKRNGGTW